MALADPSAANGTSTRTTASRGLGLPSEPADCRASHDHSILWQTIVAAGVNSFGEANAARLAWPLDRAEALQQLDAFIENALPHFGDFQDAMSHRSWRMFHSLLSFALNTKMLDPREVVARAEAAWRAGSVSLATAEGFIRQIIGWREYIRGFYWAHMPSMSSRTSSATRGRCRDGSGTVRPGCAVSPTPSASPSSRPTPTTSSD
jgi:deoxyribodipyrimidine photolyase-like uncharacterized protein